MLNQLYKRYNIQIILFEAKMSNPFSVLRVRKTIPHICHFFTRAKFLENKIYTKKTHKLRQNTQKIVNFLRWICKNLHRPKKFTRIYSWRSWQIWGMVVYLFHAGAPFSTKNAQFWPVLTIIGYFVTNLRPVLAIFGYFVTNSRTFWCPLYRP